MIDTRYSVLYRCGGCDELVVNGTVGVPLDRPGMSKQSALRVAALEYRDQNKGPIFHECVGGPNDIAGVWKLGVALFVGFRENKFQ